MQSNLGTMRDSNFNFQWTASHIVTLALNETVNMSAVVFNGALSVVLNGSQNGCTFGGYQIA